MTIETITEHGDPNPDPERDDSILPVQADVEPTTPPATRAGPRHRHDRRLLEEHPAVAKAIRDTLRHPGLSAGTGRAHRPGRGRPRQHRTARGQPGRQARSGPSRSLGFGLGLALVVALVILDAVPLNWAAQAFGLDSTGTWLVTFILVVASVGAMLAFEVTRDHRRGVASTGGGQWGTSPSSDSAPVPYHGLQESLPVALLQSALLTAISAGLVLCGSAVLARTRFLSHSRARAAVRRSVQVAAAAARE